MPAYNPVFADRVWERAPVSGAGVVTLADTAVAGYRTFRASMPANSSVVRYGIVDTVTNAWEVGIATVTAPATGSCTLAREVVLSSSNGGSAVAFAGNSCDVFVTQTASGAAHGMLPFALGNWYSAAGSSGGALPAASIITAHPFRWRGAAKPVALAIRCTAAPTASTTFALAIYDERDGVPQMRLTNSTALLVAATEFLAATVTMPDLVERSHVFLAVGAPANVNGAQLAALGAGYNNANWQLAESLGSADPAATPAFGYQANWTPGALPAFFPLMAMDPVTPVIRVWVKF